MMRASKKQMLGAKLDLSQVTGSLTNVMKRKPMLAKAPSSVAFFAMLHDKAPKFTYQSNDIIATLEDLAVNFQSMKKSLDLDEINAKAVFEKTRMGLLSE